MSLGDVISRVLTEFRADTSQMKGALKELSGIEKERAQQQLKDAEAANKYQESAIKKLGQVGLALDTVGKFADFARDAMKSYGEHMRLEAATAGINVGKLSEAFGGLISQHDVLTLAAQTQTGVFRLNQDEMETLGKAAVAMKNRGFDLSESFKKLTEAAVKGKVGGLDDLGLSIEEGASKAQTMRNLMGELNKVIAESGTATSNAADDVTRMGVAWENTTESLKRFSAEAIMQLAEPLKMIQDIKDEIERGKAQLNGTAVSQDQVFGAFKNAAVARYNQPTKEQLQAKARADAENIEMSDDNLEGAVKALRDARRKAFEKDIADEARERAELIIMNFEEANAAAIARMEEDQANNAISRVHSLLTPPLGAQAYDQEAMREAIARASAEADKMNAKAYEAFNTQQSNSKMEQIFGPIEEVDLYGEAFMKLGQTFGAFSEAVSSSYEVIVTGQGSVSAAFKRVMADGLMAIGKSSVVSALRETALGFGALAFGSPTAAMHFKSAGLHAAVAVAAGAAANAMGAGSGGSSPAASGSSASSSASTGGGSSGSIDKPSGKGDLRPINIIVGESFTDASPRMRSIRAREAVDKAIRERDE